MSRRKAISLPVLCLLVAALTLASAHRLAAALATSSTPPVPPRPGRYVTDPAGTLPPARADALNEKLAAFERETSAQVLVWIAPRVPEGTTPEELGAAAIRAWGVGQKGKDNGLVFFVFTEDRKMRVATGYGLEGVIPDAVAKRITSEVVKPYFARSDLPGGIEAGVDALLSAARGEKSAGTGKTAAERGGGSVAGWLALLAVVGIGVHAYVRRTPFVALISALGAFALVFAVAMTGVSQSYLPGAVLFLLGSFGALFIGAVRSNGVARSGGRSSSSPPSSSSDSSSSSSSSSFSGGGGDSGGGGSSDSW